MFKVIFMWLRLLTFFLSFVFFDPNLYAASVEACFPVTIERKVFIKKMKPFLLEGESVQESPGICFSFDLNEGREELISKLVKMEYPMARINRDSLMATPRKTCDFSLIKEAELEKTVKSIRSNKSRGNLSDSQSRAKTLETMTIKVSEGKHASFQFQGLEVFLHCIKKRATYTRVSLHLYSPDSQISSELDFGIQEKKELGSMIKKLDQENKNLTNKSINYQKKEEQKASKIYLIAR